MRRGARRGIRTAGVIAMITIAAAGCGGGGGKSGAGSGSASGTITWWDTSDATSEAPTFQELVAKFERQNPKIKVKYVNVPFSDAQDKFKTAASGGSGAPDVLRADIGWTTAFSSLGYLAPLDGTPAVSGWSDYLPGPVASTRWKGKTYGVPQVTDVLAVLYNKTLFAKAGISAPPATWTELSQDAALLKQKAGVTGLFLNAQGYYALPFLYGEGTDLVDVKNQKVTVNDAKAIAGITTAKELVTSGAAQTDVTKDAYSNMQTAFKDGKVAMVLNGPWSISDDLTGSAFADKTALGIAPMPAGGTGKAGSPTGGHDYVVYAGSRHLTAAETFVKFMASADSQAFIASKLGLLPTRSSVYGDASVKDNTTIAAFHTALGVAKPRVAIPQGSDLFTPLDTDIQKIMGGQATVQQGLDDAATQFRKILGWK